jgi:hypothetical protein
MTYQKELYWVGAVLAVASGFLIARTVTRLRHGDVVAGILLVGIIIAGLYRFVWMAPRFYGDYLFLN